MSPSEGGKPLEIPNPAVHLIRDFPRGTRIRLYSKDEILEGDISSIIGTPSRCSGGAFVELVNTIYLHAPRDAVDNWLGFCRVELDEIQCFQRIELSKQMESTIKTKSTEVMYRSVEIKTETGFTKLLKLMSELNEVALSFHGVNLGNNGQVGWIVLFARQTIVLLDVIELVQVVAHFWDKIYSGLLGNDNITKIVYNSRPIVDYLYFNHHVTLNNVFDCQVAEFSIQCRLEPTADAKPKIAMYKPLSCCLQTYLPYETLPVEIKLLREFERRDFSSSSPLMSRPVTEAKLCKCVAVDIKYLPCLKRELTKKMLDGYYEGVSAQMNAMLRENKSAKEHFLRVPTSIPPAVINALSPGGYSDESQSRNGRLSR